MNLANTNALPSNAIVATVERQLLEFLRNTEAELNTRTALRGARIELSSLIEAWNTDHPQRVIVDKALFTEQVLRNLVGFGPIEPLLEDEDVWEISINGPKNIFVKRHKAPPCHHNETFHDHQHLERVLGRILETSVGSTRQLDPSLGVQDAQLQDGTRIHLVHPELTRDYEFAVSIRKFASNSYNSIEDFVRSGSLSVQGGDFLHRAVVAGATILVCGAPGSGKTSFLNALINALPEQKRVLAIEETPEIRISRINHVQLHTRSERPGRKDIDLRALVKASLRMNCDVLVLGEVRDNESLALLLSLSTGIQGMSTLHAANCRDGLTRLRLLVQLSLGDAIPIWSANQIIANSIGVVVQMRRLDAGIVIEEIIAVEEGTPGADGGFITTQVFSLGPDHNTLTFTGHNPLRLRGLKVTPSLDARLLGASLQPSSVGLGSP